jgi:hypothetical protein
VVVSVGEVLLPCWRFCFGSSLVEIGVFRLVSTGSFDWWCSRTFWVNLCREINVESTLYVARVCLGLAGLTHAGQWGALCLRLISLTRVVRLFVWLRLWSPSITRVRSQLFLWYASPTGPVRPTRVIVGFCKGGRDLFCDALCLRVRLTRVVRLFGCLASTRVAEHHEGAKPALFIVRVS